MWKRKPPLEITTAYPYGHGMSVGDYINVSGFGVGRVTGVRGSTVLLFEPLTLWDRIKLRLSIWWGLTVPILSRLLGEPHKP